MVNDKWNIMKVNIVKSKSFKLAVRIVNLYKFLISDKKEFIMSKQLLRSGTSVGANIREADYAESKADFIHKMAISQKEMNETLYWIELLESTNYLSKEQFENINIDAIEVMKLITSIIKTAKKNDKQ